MDNERHYELRSGSRSRSHTPLVHSHASIEPDITEHHYDLRNRSRERSHTPGENINIKRSSSRSLPGGSSKVHDQNMETILEKNEEGTPIRNLLEQRHKKSQDLPTALKKVERRSERQKVKRGIFANGQKQNSEDQTGQNSQRNCTGTIVQEKLHRVLTSDYSSEEGEREDELNKPSSAHEIYKQAGDWWNVFPKTDYTYSEKSQCRYEIAPGVLAMPNMSRRSIHSDTETSNQLWNTSERGSMYKTANMEEENEENAENCKSLEEQHKSLPELHGTNLNAKSKIQYTMRHVEQYSCHRDVIYTVPKTAMNPRSRHVRSSASLKSINTRKYNPVSSIDSDTELDDVVSISNKSSEQRKMTQLFANFTTIVAVWFNKLLEFLKLKTVRRREYRASNEYDRYESKWYKIWQNVDRCLHYIYLFMVNVFLFDSWLLSRASTIRNWIPRKSSKVFWIALLPLLIFTGCWCLSYLSTKVTIRHFWETELFTEDSVKSGDLKLITEKLSSSIKSIKDQANEQSNRLLNISKTLEQLKENDFIWSEYNNKMLTLKKKLEEHSSVNAYGLEMESIKLQLKTLKELYLEMKSCCDSHAKPITSEDLSVREKISTSNGNIITDDRVREIVKEALKVYDADKTGRVDYALESAGGQIISTRCTQRYDIKTRAFKLLAFTLYHENNNPRTVIQGNAIQPGACWAFQGFPGYLLIKLRSPIYVTGFTVEHAPKSILPNGEMTSAPRKFNVWGFIDENDPAPVLFGDYEFIASDDSLQYFLVQNTTIETSYEYVELRVHSNHGQLDYTCLYRFRVHGRPV
ncbi:uncharacterized protein LOC143186917 isoform X2 [Calliopsis andreniformis]|uniref:uncharacterized protein LOC143186917 isoform X2 n=1 Tax=Calliopsis andreniformis TaxID=337506 RepID=UPI003FCDFFB1